MELLSVNAALGSQTNVRYYQFAVLKIDLQTNGVGKCKRGIRFTN